MTESSDESGRESSPEISDVSTAPSPRCSSPVDLNTTLAKYGLNRIMLQDICSTLITIARTAGDMMIMADPCVPKSDTKNNSSDRVTETDKAVEDMVQIALASRYPKFMFLGEETFKHGDKFTAEPTFVCDPIDGTLNFIHGFPNTATSLAFCVDKKPFVGVIYNPFRGDLFTAIKNEGAYLTTANGVVRKLPLRGIPAPMTSLNDCLVAVEWGSQRSGPNWELRTSVAQKLMTSKASGGAMVHSVRSNGSAALDFCYVAAGWIDCFWEGGVWIWDVCAGWVILEEAGGLVASANPGDFNPTLDGRLYFAVRAAKQDEQEKVVKELWALMGDRKFVF